MTGNKGDLKNTPELQGGSGKLSIWNNQNPPSPPPPRPRGKFMMQYWEHIIRTSPLPSPPLPHRVAVTKRFDFQTKLHSRLINATCLCFPSLQPPRPAWEGWVQDLARSLCFVLGQSSFLSSLGSINGYRRIVREAWWNARGVTLRWTDIPSGGGIVISRPVPIVLGNFWASFYFFYIHKGVDTASLVDWESCKSFLMLQRCADLLQRMFSLPMKCNMNCS